MNRRSFIFWRYSIDSVSSRCDWRPWLWETQQIRCLVWCWRLLSHVFLIPMSLIFFENIYFVQWGKSKQTFSLLSTLFISVYERKCTRRRKCHLSFLLFSSAHFFFLFFFFSLWEENEHKHFCRDKWFDQSGKSRRRQLLWFYYKQRKKYILESETIRSWIVDLLFRFSSVLEGKSVYKVRK